LKLQHTFSINHNSVVDGNTYTGAFTCKKMTVQDTARLGVRTAQLNGGMHFDDNKPGYGVDPQTDGLNHMIATLELTLINKPAWFDLETIIDMELLGAVYREVASFEAKFRRPNSKPGTTPSSNSEAGSSTPEESSNGPRTLGTVVEHEIQATLLP
jgi:hypothetical protein